MVRSALAVLAVLAATACSDDGAERSPGPSGSMTAPVVCEVTAPTACSDPPTTFADLKGIFEQRCAVCHSGDPMGSWPLIGYEHIASWAAEIRGQVLNCTMPPPDANSRIIVGERERILLWIRCGTPK